MSEALERDALRELVHEIVAAPELWAPHVRHRADQRIFVPLDSPAGSEAWLICWMPGHDTGFHDHDLSSGAVTLVKGQLREERLGWGGGVASALYRAGDTFDFGPSDIHRVVHPGGEPAVSIHVYSPRLRRMGAYARGQRGEMQRHPLDCGEELKPLVPLAPSR
jgi:predicted metal-dependent enzyme (double-stranded beta helix superfamily)